MTEEIIIDGINVAGCEYFAKQNERSCLEENGNCEKMPNCRYKQLKRLEQENKKLHALLNSSPQVSAKLKKENERLEQENKELKKENRYYKAELKLSCNELDKSNNWQIAERQEKNKYRSALEEIRESFLAFHQITIPFHVGDIAKLPHSLVNMISNYCTEIQDKINECLGE